MMKPRPLSDSFHHQPVYGMPLTGPAAAPPATMS